MISDKQRVDSHDMEHGKDGEWNFNQKKYCDHNN